MYSVCSQLHWLRTTSNCLEVLSMLQSYGSTVAILDPAASSDSRVLASYVSLNCLTSEQNVILCIRSGFDRLFVIIIPYGPHLLIEKLGLPVGFVI